jgi:hypothetical protein
LRHETRYRLDDLRRFATALGVAAGLSGPRASALAAHLLWYDTAGAPSFGVRCLPHWLDRLAEQDVPLKHDGVIVSELAATAVLEARRGLGPLVLAHAASIASEKARELGAGLVRVEGLEPFGSAAEIAASAAIGPTIALVLGPQPSWSLALPMAGELPAVLDSELRAASEAQPAPKRKEPPPSLDSLKPALAPWLAALAPPVGGWLVAAQAVSAFESLTAFQERVAATLPEEEGPGQLLPAPWEARRRWCREHGLVLDAAARKALATHATRLAVPFPEPASG